MSWIFILSLFNQSVYDLDTIVVTANRYPSRLKDVAQAVLVLDHSEIEARQASSLAEVLRDQAGIDVKDYGVAGSFAGANLRGIPSTGVVVMVDGQPINSILTGAADLSSVDVDEVERIEIIRGPASSLYGANALGGVVNVITRHRYEKLTYRGKTGVSAAAVPKISSANRFYLDAGTPFGRFDLGVNGRLEDSDGFRSNSRMQGFSGRGSAGYYNSPVEISSVLKYHQREYGVPGPRPLLDSLHPAPVFGDSTAASLFDQEKDQNYSGRLNVNLAASPNARWQNTLSGNGLIIDYHTVWGYGDTITEDYSWQTLTATFNSSVVIEFGSADLVFGWDARYDSLIADKVSAETGDTTWYAGQHNFAGWLEAKNVIGPVVINPSLRLDRNSGYGYFFSPQLGVVYSTTPDLLIKTTVGRAFRQPGFNDLYSPLYGNPDLKPETGNSAEVRFELGTANPASSALSLFVREIDDRIAWLPTQGGLWKPQNVNHLTIRGVEWETRFAHQDRIVVENQLTYLRGIQTNRELINADGTARDTVRPAAFVPPLALSSRWSIRLPAGLLLNLEGSFTSARKNYYEDWSQFPTIAMDTKVLEAFFVFNAGLTRAFGRVSASFGCKNLLDEEYATQFGNTVDDLDYPMPPRTYYFQMTLE